MDIQVSLKVRAAIKAKLVELGLHVDEELPDYVMVLVANRRTKPQMDQDLQLFLGDNTVKFTAWLQHVLSKLDELTNAAPSVTPTVPGPSKKEKPAADKPKLTSPKKKKVVEEKERRKHGSSAKEKKSTKEKEERSKSASSSSKSRETEKVKNANARNSEHSMKHSEVLSRKRKVSESDRAKPSTVSDKSSRGSYEKRKIEEPCATAPTKKIRKENSSDKTLKFQLKQGDKKLSQKSALSAHEDESPPKRLLPLLGEKSPDPETRKESRRSDDVNPEKDFKMPPTPLQKKTDCPPPPPVAETAEDDDFLSLNDAEDDDFLKDDKEKEDLELLRKNALESKNKARNYMRSLQINEKIIQKQKQLESDSQRLLRDSEENRNEEKLIVEKSSPRHDTKFNEATISAEGKISEDATAISPSKRSETRSSVGSRIRDILLSNKAEVKDSRGDAREILERKKKERGEVVNRFRESRDRSESPENKKLKSTVGAFIKREKYVEEDEYDPAEPEVKVASVVHVTARPKREKDATKNLVMRAFADAQKSIVISNSHQFDRRRKSRSRSRSRERGIRSRSRERGRTSGRRRSSGGDDVFERRSRSRSRYEDEQRRERNRGSISNRIGRRLRTDHVYEDENSQIRKTRSITERLGNGYKPLVKKSIHERLGVKRNRFDEVKDESNQAKESTRARDSPELDPKELRYGDIQDEDMIIVSVPTSASGRNVSLESMKERPRISISIRDDDDTTDEEQYDPVATSMELRKKSLEQHTSSRSDGGKSSDNDYIVEEYEQEETDDEIEVVIRDTSLKLPEPFDEPTQSNDLSVTSDVQQAEHDQKQQEQLKSEVELGQIMAKGLEIRTSAQATTLMAGVEGGSIPTSAATPKPFHGVWAATAYRPAPGLHISNTLNTQVPGQCKFWPECQFKDKCIYNHPRCRFGDNCKNATCLYKHTGIRVISGGLQTSTFVGRKPPEREQCKFFPTCHTLNCPFYHPTPCTFGLGCNDAKCKNYHPGETRAQKQKALLTGRKHVPAAHLLKWSKPTPTTTA